MRKDPIFSKFGKNKDCHNKRGDEDQTRDKLFDVQVELEKSEKEFKAIYDSELLKAKYDSEQGIKNPRRYAKIGAAFYCEQILKEAKKRVQQQKSDFEFTDSINRMIDALGTIKELDSEIGTWDIKTLKKQAQSLVNASDGSSKQLFKTLKIIKALDKEDDEKTVIENLVDYKVIEQWISNPSYAYKCWMSGEGSLADAVDMLDKLEAQGDTDSYIKKMRAELKAL